MVFGFPWAHDLYALLATYAVMKINIILEKMI